MTRRKNEWTNNYKNRKLTIHGNAETKQIKCTKKCTDENYYTKKMRDEKCGTKFYRRKMFDENSPDENQSWSLYIVG